MNFFLKIKGHYFVKFITKGKEDEKLKGNFLVDIIIGSEWSSCTGGRRNRGFSDFILKD